MVQLVIDFWTDGIAPEGIGYIVPKTAWDHGAVNIRAKKIHGIRSQRPIIFNSFEDLPDAVLTALKQAGVTLVPAGGASNAPE
jgi:hypothetical protein